MAYVSYDKTRRIEFFQKAAAKDKVQDKNLNQLKLKVNDTYKNCDKITTNFEPTDFADVTNIFLG